MTVSCMHAQGRSMLALIASASTEYGTVSLLFGAQVRTCQILQ